MNNPYIETYSGAKLHFLDPDPESIRIEDIAHALSNVCRYSGHCSSFYSVAEHSVYVSRLSGPRYAFCGLLHDASEAYLADISFPVKPYLENYQELEMTLMTAIAKKYCFEWPEPKEVRHADRQMLSTEAHYLIPSRGDTWDWDRLCPGEGRPVVRQGFRPGGFTPPEAENLFLFEFVKLVEENK